MFNSILTGKILIVILAINFIFRIGMVLKPIESLDTYIPDDSFLSLKISKNISEGKGPLYGKLYTNGFQPLFVFMMVPAYRIFPNDLILPVKFALILNSILDTLTLLLILKIILNLTRSKFALFFAATAWIFNSYIISTTMNGLETMLSTFILIYMMCFIIRNKLLESNKISFVNLFIFGIISGVAAFARIDNMIFSAIIYLAISNNIIIKDKDFRRFVKTSFLILIGFLIAYSPWMIYSYLYTDLIYPISGKAVRFQTTYHILNLNSNIGYYLSIFKQSIKVVLLNNLALCSVCFIAVFILTFKRKLKETINVILQNKELVLLMLFCFSLITAYSIYIPATWFFARYYFPFVSFLILITSIILGNIQISLNKFSVFLLFSVFTIIEIIGFHNKGIFYENMKNERGYIEIGQFIKTAFPDGTIIGSSQTGAFGYFADNLNVVNLDGVVNEECYKSLVNKKNIDYIRSQKIQYILGWDINAKFIRDNSINYKENDLIKIQTIPKIKSWGNYWNIYKVNYRN